MSRYENDEDTTTLTVEERLLLQAERQTKAQETIVLILEVLAFLFVLSAVLTGIALVG